MSSPSDCDDKTPDAAGDDEASPRPVIGGFEILTKVGEGGMGEVYKARQLNLDRTVALKVLPDRLAQDETYLERFYREAKAAARLRHPNIVSAIDVGCSNGRHYFAMEFVRGKSLAQILRARGRLPPKQAVDIIRQVALGLAHAHQNGIVHRDIKPSNIMVGRDGRAKLCDLGLAKREDQDEKALLQPGKTVGSPKYMAPEQARAGGVEDARSDLYSLGVTLFQTLTGRLPFEGETSRDFMRKHVLEPAPDVREFAPHVPPALAAIVAKLLEKDPSRRFQSAGELALALEEAESAMQGENGEDSDLRAPASGPCGAAFSRSDLALAAAIAAAGTAAVAGLVWALLRGG